MKENNIGIKEKRTDFLGMWRVFWNPTPEEETEEEKIQSDNTISDSDKKELLKALKNADKLSNTLLKEDKKPTKSKVKDFKGSAKSTLEQNSNPKAKNIKDMDDKELEI